MNCAHLDPAVLLRARPRLHFYALRLGRRHQDLLGRDELRSIADAAMLAAWERYDPHRAAFHTFARYWVYGAVLRAVEKELAERSQREEFGRVTPPLVDDRLHDATALRQLVARLPSDQRRVLIAHAVGGDSLSTIARAAGRHRSWAVRAYQSAVDAVRRVERTARRLKDSRTTDR